MVQNPRIRIEIGNHDIVIYVGNHDIAILEWMKIMILLFRIEIENHDITILLMVQNSG